MSNFFNKMLLDHTQLNNFEAELEIFFKTVKDLLFSSKQVNVESIVHVELLIIHEGFPMAVASRLLNTSIFFFELDS